MQGFKRFSLAINVYRGETMKIKMTEEQKLNLLLASLSNARKREAKKKYFASRKKKVRK